MANLQDAPVWVTDVGRSFHTSKTCAERYHHAECVALSEALDKTPCGTCASESLAVAWRRLRDD